MIEKAHSFVTGPNAEVTVRGRQALDGRPGRANRGAGHLTGHPGGPGPQRPRATLIFNHSGSENCGRDILYLGRRGVPGTNSPRTPRSAPVRNRDSREAACTGPIRPHCFPSRRGRFRNSVPSAPSSYPISWRSIAPVIGPASTAQKNARRPSRWPHQEW